MIKVLHFSTHNENCGIGKYQEMFIDQMADSKVVYNEFFELSPNQIKTMPKEEYQKAFNLLKEKLIDFDILHIQHEYSFFLQDELEQALAIAKELRKKSIVTVHTSANVGHKKALLKGVSPRSWVAFTRAYKLEKTMFKRFIAPLKDADLLIVHNNVTAKSLISRGINEAKIKKITIPVPKINFDYESITIKEALGVKNGDVIIATVGFLHRYKGVEHAIKSLKYLPENYKLAIIGGLHPGTDDISIYDNLADLIIEQGLRSRVFITGYVLDDKKMNALIRECDICVFPYDREYYSNVSSAALNNAFANHLPVIAYPTESFREVNSKFEAMRLTHSFNYYELYRELLNINISEFTKKSLKYSDVYSYPVVTQELVEIYKILNKS